ncbi:hypothetical protein CYY_004835, partial [Polysphondylium violaceum]
MTDKKQWGLQLPKSKLKSAFNADSDEDDDSSNSNNSNKPSTTNTLKDYIKNKENTQIEKTYKDALLEDPTAFDYDDVYDSMKKENKAKQQQAFEERSTKKDSRYIGALMDHANKKKKEFDRFKERQIQKERESEGDMYKDKDVVMSASYKRKLEQDKLEREKEEQLEKERRIQITKEFIL